jgi:hypothetical protein
LKELAESYGHRSITTIAVPRSLYNVEETYLIGSTPDSREENSRFFRTGNANGSRQKTLYGLRLLLPKRRFGFGGFDYLFIGYVYNSGTNIRYIGLFCQLLRA